ncbi:TonB-dependent receptor [Roseivirga sp.]|uniref:TonB-dependent receptor n=1 Tax=Roseivirga sp. TaxID=1964215 RepID=UPI003B51F981
MSFRSIIVLAILGLSKTFLTAQEITQTVRGVVLDENTRKPLIGATIRVLDTDSIIGAIADIEGKFRIEGVPLSSNRLLVTYAGYQRKVVSNFDLNSVKEVVLEIWLAEAINDLGDVVVTASGSQGEPMNDLALLSARAISSEQTWRYAGGFNDPAKITANFAGVANTQDGGNDIIVRGKSPKYMQWRLEGAEITTPNHFGDQNGISGIVGVLNNNLLSTSDFYTGAFPAEFGNTLSGVYDLRMRKGNNEKFEGIFGLGILGTDVTLEGPFSKDYNGSYLINFRYSTVGLLSELDLIEVEDTDITFQDASFKLWLPTEKLGSFSVFGLQAHSDLLIEDVAPDVWVTPGSDFAQIEAEDYLKGSRLWNFGVNHTIGDGERNFLETTLSYSTDDVSDRVYTIGNEDEGIASEDNFLSDLNRSAIRLRWTFHKRLNARNHLIYGGNYTLLRQKIDQFERNKDTGLQNLISFNEQVFINQSHISWKFQPSDRLTIVTGFNNQNVPFIDQTTFEPRFALSYKTGRHSKVTFGYSRMGKLESLHNYFVSTESGGIASFRPNTDLKMIKSSQWITGFQRNFGSDIRMLIEAYYERLSDVPVENNLNSSYATLNEGLELNYVDLVNRGTGKNYGIEFTLEKSMSRGYYFMFNSSVYESKYTALDGVERNTRFNGKYLINLLGGKEFTDLGKKGNQEFSVNFKSFFGGGRYILPLFRDEDGNLNVDPEAGRIYDYSKAYESKLDDLMSITLSFSYKWNLKGVVHELFLNIDNVTDNRARLRSYYDVNEPDFIGYERQVGVIPNILYRIYF